MDDRLKILSREFFPAGAVIIRQGEPGTRAFIIESGEVEI
jgi:CRP-like cAMP-binding protein